MERSKILIVTNNKNNSLLNEQQQGLHKNNNNKSLSIQKQQYLTLEKLIQEKRENIDRIKENGDKFTYLNNEISKISKTLSIEQKQLDELFIKVREINQSIQEQRKKLAELFEKREKAYPLLQTESKLIRQLGAVESKLQTARLNRSEEKQLVSHAKDIAKRIHNMRYQYSKEEKDSSSLSDLMASIEFIKQKIGDMQKSKEKIDKEIDQRKRIAIKQLVKERQKLFKEKDTLKNELAQLINETSDTIKKIKEIRAELKGKRTNKFFNHLTTIHHDKNMNGDETMVKKIKEEVQKKLDSGSKVSFDELKILYGITNT
jgi:uncharacterized coiled-coil DUF342 family protein